MKDFYRLISEAVYICAADKIKVTFVLMLQAFCPATAVIGKSLFSTEVLLHILTLSLPRSES